VTPDQDLEAVARAIVDFNLYMVLGTADEAGRPWATPVYYAPDGYTAFYWVSSPDVTHSRNVVVRPEVSIVVFDSRVPIGTGQAVYMSAVAAELASDDLEAGIDVFSRRSIEHGARPWTAEDVRAPAPIRLYRATVSAHWVLDPEASPDRRTEVDLARRSR
jgi:nitroimidazol reductase NimA-like FMN-containing flavoprotein (pyridoxamine 5'-phosphate oxidase superfamily)